MIIKNVLYSSLVINAMILCIWCGRYYSYRYSYLFSSCCWCEWSLTHIVNVGGSCMLNVLTSVIHVHIPVLIKALFLTVD